MSNPKNKFTKFLTGNGFYVALAICLVGAGTAAWVAVSRTMDGVEKGNENLIHDNTSIQQNFTPEEDVAKPQSNVTYPSKPSSSSRTPSSSAGTSSKQSVQSKPQMQQPTQQTSVYTLPVSGEVFNPFSNGQMVKNESLNEWRTHNGIDIKAQAGAEIVSAGDGTVANVYEDPVWGYTVEIEHGDRTISIYNGLSSDIKVKKGDTVKIQQTIGTLDVVPAESTYDSHLHFAMKQNGKWIDPLEAMGKLGD